MKKIPFIPKINPKTAISFMSPPPMAFVTRAIPANSSKPIAAPASLLKNIPPFIINIIPKTNPAPVKLSGIIL